MLACEIPTVTYIYFWKVSNILKPLEDNLLIYTTKYVKVDT